MSTTSIAMSMVQSVGRILFGCFHCHHIISICFPFPVCLQTNGTSRLARERSTLRAGNLTIKLLKKEDYGHYECVLENEIATIVASSLLVVNSKYTLGGKRRTWHSIIEPHSLRANTFPWNGSWTLFRYFAKRGATIKHRSDQTH